MNKKVLWKTGINLLNWSENLLIAVCIEVLVILLSQISFVCRFGFIPTYLILSSVTWSYGKENKHTESIARAIQVPHRHQQIEICNHYLGAFFNKEELELPCPLIVFLLHYLMFQT